jgi:hypothetical protein
MDFTQILALFINSKLPEDSWMHPHTAREVEIAKRRFLVTQTDAALKVIRTLGLSHYHEGPWYCVQAESPEDMQAAIQVFREQGIPAGDRTYNVSV